MKIFTGGDMKMSVVVLPEGAPGIVSLEGIPYGLIVPRIGMSASVNAQFSRSLGGSVFVYPFGENVGQVRVHFSVPVNPCASSGDSLSTFAGAHEYYRTKNLANYDFPLTVWISGVSLTGHMIGMSAEVTTEAGVMSGSFDIATVVRVMESFESSKESSRGTILPRTGPVKINPRLSSGKVQASR